MASKTGPALDLPTELSLALGGLKKDSAYLESAFTADLINTWIAAKEKDAAYVRLATVPQEYELYF
jgi:glutamine synthetase